MRKIVVCLLILSIQLSSAQKRVSITIDDVPNTQIYISHGFVSPLIRCLDSLNIPIAIFINEGLIYKTDSVAKNQLLLADWVKRYYVTPGNHTFSHARYSEVGLHDFKDDIVKGENMTRALVDPENKELRYFRFPYNDLGKDSVEQHAIVDFLKARNYISVPFTIESSDWMFNYLYEYYLSKNNNVKAHSIRRAYVDYTLAMFDYLEQVSTELFQHSIHHIFLCHDNLLNADVLPLLVNELRSKNYEFISLDEALNDPIYERKVYYKGKWGFSWIYRWVENVEKRIALMKNEPTIEAIYQEYETVKPEK